MSDEPAAVVRLTTRPQMLRDDVVDIAKELVRRAEAGEITDISVACLLANGDCESVVSATDHRVKLIGAVSLLLRDIMRG